MISVIKETTSIIGSHELDFFKAEYEISINTRHKIETGFHLINQNQLEAVKYVYKDRFILKDSLGIECSVSEASIVIYEESVYIEIIEEHTNNKYSWEIEL